VIPRGRLTFAFLVSLLGAIAVATHGVDGRRATDEGRPPPAVLLSRQLARDAHVEVGDIVTLGADPSGKRSARFRVAGVYEPTPDPMKFMIERFEARLHLPDLLALTADPRDPLAAESVSAINVALADPSDARTFAADVSRRTLGLAI
jgi:ABC-type lipoprotein release transport system permease subunit